jgi:hypothetical protein
MLSVDTIMQQKEAGSCGAFCIALHRRLSILAGLPVTVAVFWQGAIEMATARCRAAMAAEYEFVSKQVAITGDGTPVNIWEVWWHSIGRALHCLAFPMHVGTNSFCPRALAPSLVFFHEAFVKCHATIRQVKWREGADQLSEVIPDWSQPVSANCRQLAVCCTHHEDGNNTGRHQHDNLLFA